MKIARNMRCRRNQGSFTSGDFTFDRTSDFIYLGTNLNENNLVEVEIIKRLQAGNRAYYGCINLLGSRRLSRSTKLRIYNAVIRPVVTYGCEAWTIRKSDNMRLEVFENKVLRKIVGPICDPEWRRRTNIELRQATNQVKITDFIRQRRLQWAGHVARMDPFKYPNRALHHRERGKRPKGRPRNRWTDDVRKDVGRQAPWHQLAQDRDAWRDIIAEAKSRRSTHAPSS